MSALQFQSYQVRFEEQLLSESVQTLAAAFLDPFLNASTLNRQLILSSVSILLSTSASLTPENDNMTH